MNKKIKIFFSKISLVLIAALIVTATFHIQASAAIKLNKTKVTLNVGKTVTLKVKNTKKTVKWSSNNIKVATVTQKGQVKAKQEGSAVIKATVSNKTLKCTVTVKKAADTAGSRTKPLSAYDKYTSDIYYYDNYLGNFTIQLMDYKQGSEANELVASNSSNATPKESQEYIYAKFFIKYVSGTDEVNASQVINHYSNFFNSEANTQIEEIDYGVGYEVAGNGTKDMANVSLYPEAMAVCSMAILVPTGNSPITYRLQTGYDSTNLTPTYTWFTVEERS